MSKPIVPSLRWPLYERLGVPRSSTYEEIESAYQKKLSLIPTAGFRGWLCKALMFRNHYDEAFLQLGDVSRRQAYDENPNIFKVSHLPPFFC